MVHALGLNLTRWVGERGKGVVALELRWWKLSAFHHH